MGIPLFSSHLTDYKESQVFIALLILQRMSNFQCIPNRSLILSTALYRWGTRDTLGHATSFMGITVSWRYPGKFYSSLTFEAIIRLLSREFAH